MLDNVLHLLEGWKPVFAQERTAERAIEQTMASVCVVGRRPIARSIAVREGEGGSFTADYKLFSRAPWKAHELFVPILKNVLAFCDTDFVAVGGDDLGLRTPRHLVDRRPKLGLHPNLVADASAGQLQHVTGPALHQAGVDVDPTELVDDHADPAAVLRAQHPVQGGGLPGAQEPGEEDEGRFRRGRRHGRSITCAAQSSSENGGAG